MKFKTINVSESIETYHSLGLKKWRKIDACVELSDGDNEDEAYEMASRKVEQWHKQKTTSQEPEKEPEIPTVIIENKVTKESMTQDYIDKINQCKDINDLSNYNRLANTYPELKEAYNNRLNQLQ